MVDRAELRWERFDRVTPHALQRVHLNHAKMPIAIVEILEI